VDQIPILGYTHCLSFLSIIGVQLLVVSEGCRSSFICGLCGIPFAGIGLGESVSGNTDRLIEPKNVEQLIEACAELIGNKDLRRRFGENGRETVKEQFSPDRMVDTIEEVYRKLLGQK